MAKMGYIIRHGGAIGSDKAGHNGAHSIDPSLCEVYISRDTPDSDINTDGCFVHKLTKGEFKAIEKLYREINLIPWYDNMTYGAKRLHCRNFQQIYGIHGIPTKMVIYCAPYTGDTPSGGTRTAVELAKMDGIPTYNIRRMTDVQKLSEAIGVDCTFPHSKLDDLFK